MINFSLLDEAYPNDDKNLTKKKKKGGEECKPLQAPPYSMPSNCIENTNNLRKIIDDSMSQSKGKDDFKKDGIRSYDFDEMDAYLTVSNIKTNNQDSTSEYRTTPFLADYLKSLRNNFNKPISKSTDIYTNIEQFTNLTGDMNNLKVDVNLYNLFLFIFLGIVIIVLIDQITKLVTLNNK